MKDNTYQLQRHIWNDVSEDWPFYTDEERQAFRRRKPQNLTPPGSDGSTGSAASGHSSSSSHPASPQPSLKRSSAYLSSGDASPLSDHLAPPSSSPGKYLNMFKLVWTCPNLSGPSLEFTMVLKVTKKWQHIDMLIVRRSNDNFCCHLKKDDKIRHIFISSKIQFSKANLFH